MCSMRNNIKSNGSGSNCEVLANPNGLLKKHCSLTSNDLCGEGTRGYLPNEIFSPASGGIVNVMRVRAASITQGSTMLTK